MRSTGVLWPHPAIAGRSPRRGSVCECGLIRLAPLLPVQYPWQAGSQCRTHMYFFLIIGCLFLAGVIYNIVKGDYREMAGGLVISAVMFAIFFARKRKAVREAEAISTPALTPLECCKCGSRDDVSRRAYLLTYSVIVYTSKSPGEFKPVCHKCRVRAGLLYSFATSILGWWGIPWGPIYTVQAISQNFKGGIVISDEKRGA